MLKSVGSDLSRYTKGGKPLDIVAGFKGAVDFRIFILGKDRLTEQGKRKKQTGQHVQHFFSSWIPPFICKSGSLCEQSIPLI